MQRLWLFTCLLSVLMISQALAAEEGFRPIFDGQSLDGWDGNPKFWRVEDGAITGQTTADNPTKVNTFLIWRGGKPADFELRAEYRMPEPGFANSGIQYRSQEKPNMPWVVGGYQADMTGDDQYTGILYEERGRGILTLRGQKVEVGPNHKPTVVGHLGDSDELKKAIRPQEWNEYRIVAQGNRLQHIINGQLMSETTDNDPERRSESGIIALQLHAGPPMKVQFRNLRIKDLP